jgi:hypothetical protein
MARPFSVLLPGSTLVSVSVPMLLSLLVSLCISMQVSPAPVMASSLAGAMAPKSWFSCQRPR